MFEQITSWSSEPFSDDLCFGCSKCRWSNRGCAKCRAGPAFRDVSAAPRDCSASASRPSVERDHAVELQGPSLMKKLRQDLDSQHQETVQDGSPAKPARPSRRHRRSQPSEALGEQKRPHKFFKATNVPGKDVPASVTFAAGQVRPGSETQAFNLPQAPLAPNATVGAPQPAQSPLRPASTQSATAADPGSSRLRQPSPVPREEQRPSKFLKLSEGRPDGPGRAGDEERRSQSPSPSSHSSMSWQGEVPDGLSQSADSTSPVASSSFLASLSREVEARRARRRPPSPVYLPSPRPDRRGKRLRLDGPSHAFARVQKGPFDERAGSGGPQTGFPSQGFPDAPKPADVPPDPAWCPPPSPFGLIEEELHSEPWRLLVACMLLNKTTAEQVRRVIWRLFDLWPTPEALAEADQEVLAGLLRPLGLYRKRALAVRRLSREYASSAWRDVRELHGVGDYAADAYAIFCRGAWREVRPADKDLRRYRDWLQRTDGLGTGLAEASQA